MKTIKCIGVLTSEGCFWHECRYPWVTRSAICNGFKEGIEDMKG